MKPAGTSHVLSETMKRWTEIITPWIQVLGLLAAGIFALIEYYAHKTEVRLQRSFDYVSRLNSAELLNAHTKLSAEEEAQSDRMNSIDDTAPQDKINVAVLKFVVCDLLKHGQKDSLEPQFLAVNAYLDEITTCVQQGWCDGGIVSAQVGNFGRNFVLMYYPYYCYLRTTWKDPSLGARVMRFFNPSTTDVCLAIADSLKTTKTTLSCAP